MAEQLSLLKVCSTCGEAKWISDFHWKYPARGIRANTCKQCANTRAAKWRAMNPERHRENLRRWAAENADAVREYKRERLHARRESDRAYHERNRERRNARVRQYWKAHPERKRAYEHKRRAEAGELAPEDFEYISVLRGDPCSYCGEPAGTVDHIQPLSGGGSSGWENLTAAVQRKEAHGGHAPVFAPERITSRRQGATTTAERPRVASQRRSERSDQCLSLIHQLIQYSLKVRAKAERLQVAAPPGSPI